MAQIRAVEFDRAVVYDSTTGYSAIISPDGRVSQRTSLWTQAEIEARVPLLTYQTLAERLGVWPEWAIVAATALALGLAATRAGASWRRRRGPGSADGPAVTAEGPASTAAGPAGTAEGPANIAEGL
jgi:apolipoprotein N-acyltransferase